MFTWSLYTFGLFHDSRVRPYSEGLLGQIVTVCLRQFLKALAVSATLHTASLTRETVRPRKWWEGIAETYARGQHSRFSESSSIPDWQ